MNLDLDNRTAVVTGGTAGIGRSVTAELIALGANVVCTYAHDADRAHRLSSELGERCIAVCADAADPSTPAALTDATLDAFGSIDIVVANAGQTARSPITDTGNDVYDRVFDTNVRSVWRLLEAATPHFGDDSRIILLSSVRTAMNTPGTALYTASKAAIEAIVRVLAVELGPIGTSVNAVAPGATDTALLRSVNDQDSIDAMSATTPLRRVGQPDDISGVVAVLAAHRSRANHRWIWTTIARSQQKRGSEPWLRWGHHPHTLRTPRLNGVASTLTRCRSGSGRPGHWRVVGRLWPGRSPGLRRERRNTRRTP